MNMIQLLHILFEAALIIALFTTWWMLEQKTQKTQDHLESTLSKAGALEALVQVLSEAIDAQTWIINHQADDLHRLRGRRAQLKYTVEQEPPDWPWWRWN